MNRVESLGDTEKADRLIAIEKKLITKQRNTPVIVVPVLPTPVEVRLSTKANTPTIIVCPKSRQREKDVCHDN